MSYIKGRKYLVKPQRIMEFYTRLADNKNDSSAFKHRKFFMRLRTLKLIWYIKGMILKDCTFRFEKDKKFLKYNRY